MNSYSYSWSVSSNSGWVKLSVSVKLLRRRVFRKGSSVWMQKSLSPSRLELSDHMSTRKRKWKETRKWQSFFFLSWVFVELQSGAIEAYQTRAVLDQWVVLHFACFAYTLPVLSLSGQVLSVFNQKCKAGFKCLCKRRNPSLVIVKAIIFKTRLGDWGIIPDENKMKSLSTHQGVSISCFSEIIKDL